MATRTPIFRTERYCYYAVHPCIDNETRPGSAPDNHVDVVRVDSTTGTIRSPLSDMILNVKPEDAFVEAAVMTLSEATR